MKIKKKKSGSNSKIKVGLLKKMVLMLAVPTAIILILIGVRLDAELSRMADDINDNYLGAELDEASEKLTGFLGSYVKIAETGANMLQLMYNTQVQEAGIWVSILSHLKEVDENISSTWVYDFSTQQILEWNGNATAVDASERDWYQGVLDNQGAFITGGYEDIFTGKNIVTVAAPIYTEGEISGIIGLDVRL